MGTFFDDGCGSDGSYIIEAGQFSEFGISAPKEEGQPKLAKRYLRSRGFHCLSAYTADRKSAEAIFKNPRISRVFLVPVLVPVCTVIWGDCVRFDAKLEKLQAKQKELVMLRMAGPCDAVQNAEKWTQNPTRPFDSERPKDCAHFCAHAPSKSVIIGHIWIAIVKREGGSKCIRGNSL